MERAELESALTDLFGGDMGARRAAAKKLVMGAVDAVGKKVLRAAEEEVDEDEEEDVPLCADCVFFDDETEGGALAGYCRRNPPQIVGFDEEDEPLVAFPAVSGADWCGEFARSEE